MKKLALFTVIVWFFTLASEAQSFRVGAAVRNITPDPLLPVSGGIGRPTPVNKKQGELTVRALVLEKGETRVAIVGVDNLGWPAALGELSRKFIKNIPPENILIGATHTHSAPDAYGFPDETLTISADTNYLNRCVQQIADAVNEAVAKLQRATLKVAVGEARGKIAYNYYAPDLYDPRCGVIQALDLSGKPIATLVNYAIHPEVIGPRQGILSPDLCGPLYDRIEKKGGGIAIFMNGAQGGMVTADNRLPDGTEANNWEECIRIGQLLADEALRIVSVAPAESNPELVCLSKKIRFPVENEVMRTIVRFSPLDYSAFKGDSVATRLNFLQIGKARVLTIPGEALPNIGYYIKRNMNAETPFLFGLTNDAFGYMLTSVDFNSFKRYDYISRTGLGELTGDIYIKQVLNWLKEIDEKPDSF